MNINRLNLKIKVIDKDAFVILKRGIIVLKFRMIILKFRTIILNFRMNNMFASDDFYYLIKHTFLPVRDKKRKAGYPKISCL